MFDFLARRPQIELQARLADCGYICASALLAHHGVTLRVADIKRIAGSTSRGLQLRQLRDVLIACGADAHAVRFDPADPKTYPVPGVVLLKRGHYAMLASVRKDRLVAYYPERGWVRVRAKDIASGLTGLGVIALAMTASPTPTHAERARSATLALKIVRTAVSKSLGKSVIGLSALTQLIVLLLPLVAMQSADKFKFGAGGGVITQISLGFLLITVTSSMARILSLILNGVLLRHLAIDMASKTFNRLIAKPPQWFEEVLPDSIRNTFVSIDNIQRFCAEVVPLIGSVLITLVVGIIAFFFFSPWLALPGLIFMIANMAIELAFQSYKAGVIVSMIDAFQRRSAYIHDVLSQAPLLLRQGGIRRSRRNYVRMTKRALEAEAELERFNNIKAALSAVLKSFDSLMFVSVAALFMGKGHYSLGAFVAVGAYKDLISQALTSVFQMFERYRTLATHVRQSEELVGQAPISKVSRALVNDGGIVLQGVGFQYSSFEPPTLDDVSLTIEPGEFVILAGPSGAGKSTLVKLLCGLLQPTSGSVRIGGIDQHGPWDGVNSMLQSDRLIAGTIRDNVAMFRGGVSDDEIYQALAVAELEAFVLALPMRLNTMVSEGGGGLSGGQRQRLLLARTVLFAPRVLILDEATSALDVAMESRVLQNLKQLSSTIVLVAHRPETWSYASKIYDVDQGRVVQRAAQSPKPRLALDAPHSAAAMSRV